jgi:hypothetical protein
MNVEQARKLLKENGYFVDNLWTIHDVQGKFKCTDEEAQEVLEKSLTNEATMEQIWFSINEFGREFGLEEVQEEEEEG